MKTKVIKMLIGIMLAFSAVSPGHAFAGLLDFGGPAKDFLSSDLYIMNKLNPAQIYMETSIKVSDLVSYYKKDSKLAWEKAKDHDGWILRITRSDEMTKKDTNFAYLFWSSKDVGVIAVRATIDSEDVPTGMFVSGLKSLTEKIQNKNAPNRAAASSK